MIIWASSTGWLSAGKLELTVEGFDERRLGTGGLGGAQWVAVNVLNFHRATGFVVEHHAGFVGLHLQRVGEHFLDMAFRYFAATGTGLGNNFAHQRFAEVAGVRVGHEPVGGGVEDDGETVVGDIPDELLPASGAEVFGEMGFDVGTLEVDSDVAKPVGDAAVVFAEADVAVVEMLDVAGGNFVGAEETESADDSLRADDAGGLVFVAETVLHHEHDSGVFDDVWKDGRQEVILCGFQADGDDIAGGHVAGVPVGVNFGEVEVAFNGVADEAVPGDVVIVGVEEKMDFGTGVLEARAVEASQCSGADDGVGSCAHWLFYSKAKPASHGCRHRASS